MPLFVSLTMGAILGASSRYYLAICVQKWLETGFPWATLLINIVGSFLMGILFEYFSIKNQLESWRIFALVGFLGSFTTFSTFSLDLFLLLKQSLWGQAFFYGMGSVILSLAALMMGLFLMRFLSY